VDGHHIVFLSLFNIKQNVFNQFNIQIRVCVIAKYWSILARQFHTSSMLKCFEKWGQIKNALLFAILAKNDRTVDASRRHTIGDQILRQLRVTR